MKIGVVFPHLEIGQDPIAVKDFVQAVEDLGYDYLLTYEEVTVTNLEKPIRWREPFTVLSFIAAVTQKIELATGIIVLPSRQTLLVAKQAAELDLLSNGRLRLGFSVGWNKKEYQAMGVNFPRRGQRIEEQVTVLRKLWAESSVTFEGEYHTLDGVGITPLPVQKPIPIWFGGQADATLRRVAKMGDGWMTNPDHVNLETAPALFEKLYDYVEAAGRKREEVGIDVVGVKITEKRDWGRVVQTYRDLGATHLNGITMDAGLSKPQDHIDTIRRFKEQLLEIRNNL
jgi:probable F420-dependent oxidoreductase